MPLSSLYSLAAPAIPHEGRIGIIDIGSNSIRLVVYDGIKRVPLPLYNEKTFCALGKGLATTGKLNPEGVRLAKACIERLLVIAQLMDVVELKILATAAVRDAKDGAAFVKAIEKQHKINISIISGKREARYAAEGVMSAFHKPRGLVGDMGGGSIELIDLNGHDIRAQDTIPIGPLRILDLSKNAPEKMRKLIDKALGDLAWLGKTRQPRFYAVGGSFRALAHIHMQRSGYPLGLVHHFSIGAEEAKKLARSVQIMKPEIIAKLPGVPGKRANAMIPAAIVLQRIIEITKVNEVVFSTSGIREGFLYEKLSPGVRAEDPLIASATDLALDPARGVLAYAAELYNWMQPLFAREDEGKKRLRMAACILSEIARKMHTEYRADWAFHHILQSSLTGVTHGERVTVALCAFHRYQAKMKKDPAALSLIAQNDKNWARMVGLAMNLAYHLSGGMAGNLTHARIKPLRCAVQLQLSPKVKGLMSDTVKKRLEGLGEAFKAASRRVR